MAFSIMCLRHTKGSLSKFHLTNTSDKDYALLLGAGGLRERNCVLAKERTGNKMGQIEGVIFGKLFGSRPPTSGSFH